MIVLLLFVAQLICCYLAIFLSGSVLFFLYVSSISFLLCRWNCLNIVTDIIKYERQHWFCSASSHQENKRGDITRNCIVFLFLIYNTWICMCSIYTISRFSSFWLTNWEDLRWFYIRAEYSVPEHVEWNVIVGLVTSKLIQIRVYYYSNNYWRLEFSALVYCI